MAFTACVKEDIFEESSTRPVGEERTFTVSFAEDGSDTRTDIVQGKTVWSTGDQLMVTNGTYADTVVVPEAANGKKFFDFSTTLTGTIYVVYPARAYNQMTSDNKFVLDIPRVQDGTFGSANIAVAVASDRKVQMHNVTSVLKFRIPSSVETPIKVVSINSVGNNVTGTFSVDMASGTPVISTPDTLQINDSTSFATSYTGDAVVKVDGLSGSNFYATVIPGTYTKGFSMTAVTLDLDNASESKTTVSDKALGINELFDLGTIGTNLQPLGGDGSESNPYIITNLPEYLVFTYYVNEGNSMAGKYVKVTNDISGITTPVGIWDESENADDFAFQGNFDGGDHTFTVNMNQDGKLSLGLFSYVDDSASIHNVKVAGTITTTYKNTGSIAGIVFCNQGVTFDNCSSSAAIKTTNNSGGLIGYAYNSNETEATLKISNCSFSGSLEGTNNIGGILGQAATRSGNYSSRLEITNCENSGSINGTHTAGGIVGYSYMSSISNCKNTGAVTSTVSGGGFMSYNGRNMNYQAGSAGIAGYAQNTTIKNCSNEAAIVGVRKNGGIVGSMYFSNVISCVNRGDITSTDQTAAGIVGYNFVQGSISSCQNYGTIEAGTYQAAGILGFGATWYRYSTPYIITVSKCTNNGKCSSGKNAAAGIVGYTENQNAVHKLIINRCINAEDAEITSADAVGGILGCKTDYYNWCRAEILNCENHAKVTGTGKGARVGGIYGASLRNPNGQRQGIMIYNSYNDGDVVYTNTEGNPNVGGIVGYYSGGDIWNCYNGGRVGNADTTAALTARDSLYCGALVGGTGFQRNLNGYYLAIEGTTKLAIGTKARVNNNGIYSVDASGNLGEVATINDVAYNNVVDALNAGIGTQTQYYHWVAGPKFDYGTVTDPVDGGGFDIGDGGEI